MASFSTVTSRTFAWTVQRSDGAGFAATGHDRPLRASGWIFDPVQSTPKVDLHLTSAMVGSRLAIENAFAHSSVSEGTDDRCRWLGSSIDLTLRDWSGAEEAITLARGKVERFADDAGAIAEIRVTPDTLLPPPCVKVSASCRASFGDQKCGVSLRSRTCRIRILSCEEDWIVLARSDLGAFANGSVRLAGGPRCGSQFTILQTDGSKLRLLGAPPSDALVGYDAYLTEGCDGSFVMCRDRFDNAENFRGEPDLPGAIVDPSLAM